MENIIIPLLALSVVVLSSVIAIIKVNKIKKNI